MVGLCGHSGAPHPPMRYGHPSPDVLVLPAGVSLPPLQGRKHLWASLALSWVLTSSCLGGRGQVGFSCSRALLVPLIGPLHQPNSPVQVQIKALYAASTPRHTNLSRIGFLSYQIIHVIMSYDLSGKRTGRRDWKSTPRFGPSPDVFI